jgi:glucose/arabinose dehydrogenase
VHRVEQPGRIRIVEDGKLVDEPFLDVRSKVGYGGERGLLSVAFHPHYRANGLLFVNYTNKRGDTRIERYTVSADKSVADPASAKLILAIDQPYANHNGGLAMFGPDGMLYIGMGDGGWNTMEGPSCYRLPLCMKSGLQQPAFSYSHDAGACSIIGGFVYRGRKIPEIQGQYFYSDYCNSWVRSYTYSADGTNRAWHQWLDGGLGSIVSFGEDAQGELYICSSNGRVYRIVKSAGSSSR